MRGPRTSSFMTTPGVEPGRRLVLRLHLGAPWITHGPLFRALPPKVPLTEVTLCAIIRGSHIVLLPHKRRKHRTHPEVARSDPAQSPKGRRQAPDGMAPQPNRPVGVYTHALHPASAPTSVGSKGQGSTRFWPTSATFGFPGGRGHNRPHPGSRRPTVVRSPTSRSAPDSVQMP